MANNSLQYSLRTLLWVTTILAICLAFVPFLTLLCLCIAAIGGTALVLIELTVYFYRAFSWLIAVVNFVIGVCGLGFIAAVALDEVEGYTAPMRLTAVVVFGFFTSISFYGAACAYRDARSDSDSAGDASLQRPKTTQLRDRVNNSQP